MRDFSFEHYPDFNDYLDDQGVFAVEAHGWKYPASKGLYELDAEAYNQALLTWREEQRIWLRNEVVSFRRNKDYLTTLAAQFRHIVPFIGAGLSMACNLPGWTDFLVQQAELVGMSREKIAERLHTGEYEAVAGEVEEEVGQEGFSVSIRAVFGRAGSVKGAMLRVPIMQPDFIMTTNFDSVLEQTFESSAESIPTVIGPGEDTMLRQISNGEQVLLKLHGHAELPQSRVLTPAEYDTAYGEGAVDFGRPLPHALQNIFSRHRLLFLGCSLRSDRVMDLLKSVVDDGAQQTPDHFALLEAPDDQEIVERERFLTDRHIMPIWYPQGEHRAVTHLLDLLLDVKDESINIHEFLETS